MPLICTSIDNIVILFIYLFGSNTNIKTSILDSFVYHHVVNLTVNEKMQSIVLIFVTTGGFSVYLFVCFKIIK